MKTKQELDTVLFAGSTACFRREAIEKVGGLPEDTFTEDNALANKLMTHNMYGLFYDSYGSVGTVPYGFRAQIAQLWRWSHGGAHVFNTQGKAILQSSHLSWTQKIDMTTILLITPSLVIYYFYVFTFIPLFAAGINPPRYEIFGISGLILVPILPAFTYMVISGVAMKEVETFDVDFKLTQLPGYLIIGLASNILIMYSGITGILGKYGPHSPRGRWSRKVKIRWIALGSSLIGLMFTYLGYMWLQQGFSGAILLFVIGISLVPNIVIVLYYDLIDDSQPKDRILDNS